MKNENSMENQILIREAASPEDIELFWEQLHEYHRCDIFPEPDSEELEYFLGTEYYEQMMFVHGRQQDKCYFLFFNRNGQDIGFAMPVLFPSEDGKCFIMEFCVYPEFRGNGTGKECAGTLLNWAKGNDALYFELNYGDNERRRNFWKSMGFIENGADEWGNPLMILLPEEDVPFSVEILSDPMDWQLLKLENGFKREIGEEPLTEEMQKRLQQAVKEGKITFFIARREDRIVGMCSAARYYSTFSCSETAVFEDFYIEPAFRKKGIAGKLARAVQNWCNANEISSLTVCCAPCDEKMYQALGFEIELGRTFAYI